MMEALSGIIDNVILALGPLIDAAGDEQRFQALLAELGWTVNSVPQPLLNFATAGSGLIDIIGSDDVSPEQALGTVKQLIEAILAIETYADTAFPSDVDIAVFKATIGRDLLDYVVVEHLLHNVSRLGILLKLAGIIRIVQTPAAGLRGPYRKRVVLWSRIGELLTDPIKGFKETTDWNSAAPQLAQGVADLANLLEFHDLQLSYFVPRGDQLAFVNAGAPVPLADPLGVDMGFHFDVGTSAGASAGFQFLLRPPTTERGYGFSILPYALLNGAQSIPLGATLTLTIGGDADFTKGVSVTFAPGHPVETQSGFLGGAPVSPAKMEVGLKFTPAAGDTERVLVGAADGSRLAVNSIELSLGADLISPSQLDAFVEVGFNDAHIVVQPAPGEADSFLGSLIGPNGVSATFSCGVRLSSLTNFHFTGSGMLQVNIPVNAMIGPIGFQALSVGLKPAAGGGFDLNIGANVTGTVGPLSIVVDQIGFTLSARFPDPPAGNLGPLDAGFNFLPPSGAGLSLDSAGVSGGGFLAHDDAKQEYSGVLQLEFNQIALQAFGLITTQVAGAAGYSLLALVDANFPPIQLGWGFTLNGAGGLLAMHRTADADALGAALKADKLGTILFPTNAITNGPQLLAQLDAWFPTAQGRFLFGPIALIDWGTPTLLTAALALILELPEPIRLILLARIAVRAPSQSNALVRINVDALGVLDLSQDTLWLQATIYDSRLLSYTLSGDLALQAGWGNQREFLLAIGGFHPRFTPPPGFPTLQRITVAMSDSVLKLRLTGYLAVTSNSLQFGANLDASISISGFGLSGHLGFDALLQRNPFHFDADISGSVAITIDGEDIASVGLDAALSGPAPWHIAGKFKIDLFLFSVSKSFSHTWGEDAPAEQIQPIAVLPLLTAALTDARNWGAQLAANTPPLLALRSQDGASLLVHPLAELEVRESVVPLDLQLTRFGAAPLSGADTFTVSDLRINGAAISTQMVQEDFAPAQFFDLSDEEKLARPSFEPHDAGIQTAMTLAASGSSLAKTISYETWYLDTSGAAPRPQDSATPPIHILGTDLTAILSLGSAARSANTHSAAQRYQSPGQPIVIAPEHFTIADTSTLAWAGLAPAAGATYSNVQAILNQTLAQAPARRNQLQIIATYEAATA